MEVEHELGEEVI